MTKYGAVQTLRRIRKLGAQRKAVALALGVQHQIVGKWERGQLKPGQQSVVMISLLANLLDAWTARGWSINEFLDTLSQEGMKGILEAMV